MFDFTEKNAWVVDLYAESTERGRKAGGIVVGRVAAAIKTVGDQFATNREGREMSIALANTVRRERAQARVPNSFGIVSFPCAVQHLVGGYQQEQSICWNRRAMTQ